MKKVLIILLLTICGISANAQNLYDQCANEVESILNDAETILYNNDTINLYTPERQAQKAKEQFNVVVSKYNILLNSTIDSDEVDELGQCGYYELGHIAYIMGNNTMATSYYNKAKSILNDDNIIPYEEM